MKRFAMILLAAMAMTHTVRAAGLCRITEHAMLQDNRKQFDADAFRKDMETYIVHHASLSDDEAAAALPLLRDMHHHMLKANEEARDIRKSVKGNATETEARQALDKILALGQRESALRAEFMNKIAAKVGAAKAIAIMKAEDRFHRQMFRNGARGANGNHPANGHKAPGEERHRGKNVKK